ncbi:hypothetical protein JHK86_007416 [Glycine max]|nr:hypothetical protein JHK86_007416 [Glycine max]
MPGHRSPSHAVIVKGHFPSLSRVGPFVFHFPILCGRGCHWFGISPLFRLIFCQKSGIKILCLWKDFVMKESIRYWFLSTCQVDPWLITSMVLIG